MNKKRSIASLAFNVILIVLGIIMLCTPDSSLGWVMVVLGIGIIIYSLVLVLGWYKQHKAGAKTTFASIAFPVITLLFGIVVIIFNHQLAYILFPIIIAVWALIEGFFGVRAALTFKDAGLGAWRFQMIFSLIYFIVGVVIVVNMFAFGQLVTILLGILFIIFGLAGVLGSGTDVMTRKKLNK